MRVFDTHLRRESLSRSPGCSGRSPASPSLLSLKALLPYPEPSVRMLPPLAARPWRAGVASRTGQSARRRGPPRQQRLRLKGTRPRSCSCRWGPRHLQQCAPPRDAARTWALTTSRTSLTRCTASAAPRRRRGQGSTGPACDECPQQGTTPPAKQPPRLEPERARCTAPAPPRRTSVRRRHGRSRPLPEPEHPAPIRGGPGGTRHGCCPTGAGGRGRKCPCDACHRGGEGSGRAKGSLGPSVLRARRIHRAWWCREVSCCPCRGRSRCPCPGCSRRACRGRSRRACRGRSRRACCERRFASRSVRGSGGGSGSGSRSNTGPPGRQQPSRRRLRQQPPPRPAPRASRYASRCRRRLLLSRTTTRRSAHVTTTTNPPALHTLRAGRGRRLRKRRWAGRHPHRVAQRRRWCACLPPPVVGCASPFSPLCVVCRGPGRFPIDFLTPGRTAAADLLHPFASLAPRPHCSLSTCQAGVFADDSPDCIMTWPVPPGIRVVRGPAWTWGDQARWEETASRGASLTGGERLLVRKGRAWLRAGFTHCAHAFANRLRRRRPLPRRCRAPAPNAPRLLVARRTEAPGPSASSFLPSPAPRRTRCGCGGPAAPSSPTPPAAAPTPTCASPPPRSSPPPPGTAATSFGTCPTSPWARRWSAGPTGPPPSKRTTACPGASGRFSTTAGSGLAGTERRGGGAAPSPRSFP